MQRNRQQSPEKIPLTQQTWDNKMRELHRLKKLRAEVLERLKIAREMGDLSENGAYTAAKFELGSIGRQLREVRFILKNGYVAAKQPSQTVAFGQTVTIEFIETGKISTFLIVSGHESNPLEGKLSFSSPIGAAIFGHTSGEVVTAVTPKGELPIKIKSIELV